MASLIYDKSFEYSPPRVRVNRIWIHTDTSFPYLSVFFDRLESDDGDIIEYEDYTHEEYTEAFWNEPLDPDQEMLDLIRDRLGIPNDVFFDHDLTLDANEQWCDNVQLRLSKSLFKYLTHKYRKEIEKDSYAIGTHKTLRKPTQEEEEKGSTR